MIAYRYHAAHRDGTVLRGVVEVVDRAEALAILDSRGLLPIRLQPTYLRGERTLGRADLAVGLRTLATLLSAGLTVIRALEALTDSAPPSWRAGIARMQNAVRRGEGLSTAMEQCGLKVPRLFVGIIRAGEAGSGLAAAVRRAADLAEADAALRSSIAQALAYPAVLLTVGGLSVAVIMEVVLPRFAQLIADLGASTPPLTRFTLDAGRVLAAGFLPVVMVAGVMALGVRRVSRTGEGARRITATLLRLPLIGEVRLALASSRVCASLAALIASGVPIAPALQHAAAAAGDAEIEARLSRARTRVINGSSLSAALATEHGVTQAACRLLRAGEESGELAAMLGRAGELDAGAAAGRLNTAVRLIEPLLIVAFAGVVALVAAALLQAVYAVRPS